MTGRALGETTVVLNHAGQPADRSPEGFAGWRIALAALAASPHPHIKISGIGVPARPWSDDDNGEIIRYDLDTFGPGRAMFASNFPVDGLCGSFDTISSRFADVTRDDPPEYRDKHRRKSATRVYGLDHLNPD